MTDIDIGHFAATLSDGTKLDGWGAGPFLIKSGDRVWRFEDSVRFGPYLVSKSGRVLERQPGERSKFWRPHLLWCRQGRKVKDDGVTCIWREPKPHLVRVVDREIFTVEPGEQDGLMVNMDTGAVIDD